jgi:hypothetical protein
MRRRARVLSATALVAVVLGAAAPAASADPAAEVSPDTVAPGGTITVSVACDPTGGPLPDTIDASSQAFEQGTVQLRRVPGNDDSATGPSYNGTARIAPAGDFETGRDGAGKSSEWGVDGICPAPPGGEGKQWSTTFTVSLGGDQHGDDQRNLGRHGLDPQDGDQEGMDPQGGDEQGMDPQDGDQEGMDPQGGDEQGMDPQGGDQHGKESHTDQHSQEPHTDPQGKEPHVDHPRASASHPAPHAASRHTTHPPVVEHGVHAGGGGAFTDSVPALVAGGLLIAGALGAAVQRLRRKLSARR